MKKRLNVLCVIVMLVLGYSVFETGYYFTIGLRAGFDAARHEQTVSPEQLDRLSNMRYISVMPDDLDGWEGLFADSVYNEKSASHIPVTYSSLLVGVDTQSDAKLMWARALLSLLVIAFYLCALEQFVRLVVAINRGEIFCWRNVRRLRHIGIALILSFLCILAASYIDKWQVEQCLQIRGYHLIVADAVQVTTLIIGLCALVVGEVFAIGLKMKEEQELTI
ncbi:MAG: DUF2975 domain-containing protein [Mediterranea sp.]|nr:DUF2975 domain-containing protein [Mediterranea sp.]